VSTVYFDCGGSFRAQDYRQATMHIGPDGRFGVCFDLSGLGNLRRLRFDPCDYACKIRLLSANGGPPDKFTALNGFAADGSVCFLSNDPNFLLEDVGLIADSTLEITGEIHKLAAADVIAVLDKEKTVWDESIRRAREEAEALTREAGQIRQERDGLKALSERAAAENAALTGKIADLELAAARHALERVQFQRVSAAYDSVIHSACWRMTRPLRVVLDTTKYVWRSASRHINRLFFLAGKTLAVIRYGGVRTAAKKIRAKLFGQKPGHDGGVPVHKPVGSDRERRAGGDGTNGVRRYPHEKRRRGIFAAA
jgi:hypothetical protein